MRDFNEDPNGFNANELGSSGLIISAEEVSVASQLKIDVIEGFDQLDKNVSLLINA
jgi:hypothetical protein